MIALWKIYAKINLFSEVFGEVFEKLFFHVFLLIEDITFVAQQMNVSDLDLL